MQNNDRNERNRKARPNMSKSNTNAKPHPMQTAIQIAAAGLLLAASFSAAAPLRAEDSTTPANAPGSGETVVYPANGASKGIDRYLGAEYVYSDGKSTPDSISLLHIPDADIVDYVVPDGFTAISSEVFKNCKKLESVTLPDSVNSIEAGAFSGHKTLKRVSLPAHCSIGGGAFEQCEALESVTVRKDAGAGASAPENAEIGEQAFAECRKLTHMEVPDGVKTIGVRAFDTCLAMKTIEIPDSVEKIEYAAFWLCDELEAVELSAVHPVSIGEDAFHYCSKLRHFRLPPGTEEIGEQTFYGCLGLKSFEASEGLKKIGEDAFRSCRSLRDVKLPGSVETIGYGAFYDCNSLLKVDIPADSNLKRIGVDAFGHENTIWTWQSGEEFRTGLGNDPESPEKVRGNTRRSGIVLPDRIETFAGAFELGIWRPAFSPENTRYRFTEEGVLIDEETKTLLRAPTGLQGHYTIPDGIRAIGPWAFRSCQLTGVTIPSSVTSIGTAAFYGSDIEKIAIPDTVTEFKVEELVPGFTISRVTAINSKDSHPFLDLERGIFGDCKKLKRVALPENMKEVPVAMFNGCDSLEEIEIPAGCAVIGKCAFMSCPNLKRVALPAGLSAIEENAFGNCPKLEKADLPEGLTRIEKFAFVSSPLLKEIRIPESVNSIAKDAFWGEGKKYVQEHYGHLLK